MESKEWGGKESGEWRGQGHGQYQGELSKTRRNQNKAELSITRRTERNTKTEHRGLLSEAGKEKRRGVHRRSRKDGEKERKELSRIVSSGAQARRKYASHCYPVKN
jgi:hypothetical protein